MYIYAYMYIYDPKMHKFHNSRFMTSLSDCGMTTFSTNSHFQTHFHLYIAELIDYSIPDVEFWKPRIKQCKQK